MKNYLGPCLRQLLTLLEIDLDKMWSFRSLGVTPSDLVIDLGSGRGQYSQQMASVTGCKVVALDLSLARVVETRTATGDGAA